MTLITYDRRVASSPSAPTTPRLLLDRTGAMNTLLDGAWWPHSTDPVAELPGLVLAIDGLRAPVTRLILRGTDWTDHPRLLGVDGRVIRIGYFASQPVSLLTAICGQRGRVDLLIVPPDTPRQSAEAAMKLTVAAGNQVHAQDILRTVLAAPAAAKGDPESVWEAEGGHLAR
jgi:hypothetical protein